MVQGEVSVGAVISWIFGDGRNDYRLKRIISSPRFDGNTALPSFRDDLISFNSIILGTVRLF